jgi:uncharacterized protein (TIGR02421 family)
VPSTDHDRYRTAARVLYDVARPLRVLAALTWPAEVRAEFLASGASTLPAPTYRAVDPGPVLDGVGVARSHLQPGELVDDWLLNQADALETTARMLAAVGTPAFGEHSRAVFGAPDRPLRHDPVTPLQLAQRVHHAIEGLTDLQLAAPPTRDRTADDVAAHLEAVVAEFFGADAPRIEIVDELSANAVATASRIRIRRDAAFTAKDAAQLLNHEAFIHVATSLNGRAQTDLPILAIGHPGTTHTQEGLAVYSEYVSGTLGLDRLRRLADRTVAVQLALDGADFIEVYRWFLERSPGPEQAFESTRRVFRGAPLTGGAAFTKDCTYLSGLLSVATFVRVAFVSGRSDLLALLFAGKLDLFAVPALARLRAEGLCRPARFVPPWALDPGWVLSHLTISTFLAQVDLEGVAEAVSEVFDQSPRVDIGDRVTAGGAQRPAGTRTS